MRFKATKQIDDKNSILEVHKSPANWAFNEEEAALNNYPCNFFFSKSLRAAGFILPPDAFIA